MANVESFQNFDLKISRLINAPRDVVWKAWIDPQRLALWWGPKGFTNPVCKLDLRPGGSIRIDMRGPDGTVYPMSGQFKEVTVPSRLVFISSALDQKGKPLFEVLTTVTFDEEHKKTNLTLNAKVVKTTPDAGQYLSGMSDGWNQSMDRLEHYVSKS